MEKPTALWLSQILLGIHPFQVCRDPVAAPRSRCWVALLGWAWPLCLAQLSCALHVKPMCSRAAARPCWGGQDMGGFAGSWPQAPWTAGLLSLPMLVLWNVQGETGWGTRSSGHQSWATQLCVRWEVHMCSQTMLGHSQGCLLLVTSVWPLCDSSVLLVSPLFLIFRVETGCWSPILACCLYFCAPWEADKHGTPPRGFPWSLWAPSLSSDTKICLVTEADCFHEAQKCNLPVLKLQY